MLSIHSPATCHATGLPVRMFASKTSAGAPFQVCSCRNHEGKVLVLTCPVEFCWPNYICTLTVYESAICGCHHAVPSRCLPELHRKSLGFITVNPRVCIVSHACVIIAECEWFRIDYSIVVLPRFACGMCQLIAASVQ